MLTGTCKTIENSYGCVICQTRHFECQPIYSQHILSQSKHGIDRREHLFPFTLVDPNNGGAVMDLEYLTEKDALDRNRVRRANGSDYRWIQAREQK